MVVRDPSSPGARRPRQPFSWGQGLRLALVVILLLAGLLVLAAFAMAQYMAPMGNK